MKRAILLLLLFSAACASRGANGKTHHPAAETTTSGVLSMPIAGTAAVAVRVLFYSGSVDDPKGKEGLTTLSAQLIAEGGSAAMSYPELLKTLYPMATEIRTQVDKEVTVFSALVHKDHVAKMAPILAEVLTQPRLGEKDLERIRQDMINDLEKRLRATDDENLGKEALNQMLYPAGHPYHHSVLGTVQGLKSITVADVKAQVGRVFGKKRLVIGLSGAVDADVERTFTAALQALPDGEARLEQIPEPPPVARTEVLIVQKAAKAVAVSAGTPHAATRSHPDFSALALIQSYFGEHRQFHGILMSQMREKRGLNYGDYAYVENFIQEGWSRDVRTNIPRRKQHFELWIRPVDPKDTVFALRLALYLRDRVVKDGIDQEGLAETRQFLIGYTRLWELTPTRRLGWELDSRFYGIQDYLENYRKRLGALTEAEVDAAVQKHLAAPLKIAMVAEDAEGLRARLLSGQPSPKEYQAQVSPDLLAMDQEVISYPLGLTEDQVKIVKVEELFER